MVECFSDLKGRCCFSRSHVLLLGIVVFVKGFAHAMRIPDRIRVVGDG